ncbi:hypothetical protein Cs7R123_04600 [Catellatospora sp. TT07R-123]|uniref:hypothetical protein n=1 Tax=Catellatospora sp. TT07R-123 TaxID=2733863 RepID=UPI001B1180CC|nr:hypothetical protein [Catellatospora sp. TT07R-123]GHJ43118.1 hypothetical protein Cs7R123_04600 [Catellatospora sp. TT07R-123]
MKKTTVVAVLAGVLAASAACGPDDTDGSLPGTGNGSVKKAFVTVTYDISGGTTLKGTTEAAAFVEGEILLHSCARYAEGGSKNGVGIFSMPYMEKSKIEGKTVHLQANVSPYHGPGTYEGNKPLVGVMGSEPGLFIDGEGYSVGFEKEGATSTFTVNKDGSGSWRFTRMLPNSYALKPINGTITWTCGERDL